MTSSYRLIFPILDKDYSSVTLEQALKDFGILLGLSSLTVPEGKSLRLHIETLGELDLIRQDDCILMRLSKISTFPNKEVLLEFLSATHFLAISQPIQAWLQKPNRIGFGLRFSQKEVTAHCLYQGLELLSKECRKICR